MDSHVEKLAEKAANLRIEKKSPKNWNDLPREMKEEVVKRVDFKSSLRLRQTARAERNLVDSRKFEFPHIGVYQDGQGNGCVSVWEKEEPPSPPSIMLRKTRCFESLAPFVAHILKVGNIDNFLVNCQNNFVKELVKTTESVQIKELQLVHPGLFDSAQLFVRSGKIECISVFFQDFRRYFGVQANQYVRLCKTHGVMLVEIHDGEFLARKEFTEVSAVVIHGASLPGRQILLKVKSNEAILELPGQDPIPITNGITLLAMDGSRVKFEVSEQQGNASGPWTSVMMQFV